MVIPPTTKVVCFLTTLIMKILDYNLHLLDKIPLKVGNCKFYFLYTVYKMKDEKLESIKSLLEFLKKLYQIDKILKKYNQEVKEDHEFIKNIHLESTKMLKNIELYE